MLQLGLAANNRAELRGYAGVTPDAPILVGGSAATPMTAGYYVKRRTVNTAGTPVYTDRGQQEVLI